MSLIRVGSNSRYSTGWDAVFGKSSKGSKGTKPGKGAKVATKAVGRKSASPKKKAKKR